MSEHITDLEPVRVIRRGRSRLQAKAVCSCGWEGEVQPHIEEAHNDASGHEAEAYIESLSRPLRAV